MGKVIWGTKRSRRPNYLFLIWYINIFLICNIILLYILLPANVFIYVLLYFPVLAYLSLIYDVYLLALHCRLGASTGFPQGGGGSGSHPPSKSYSISHRLFGLITGQYSSGFWHIFYLHRFFPYMSSSYIKEIMLSLFAEYH